MHRAPQLCGPSTRVNTLATRPLSLSWQPEQDIKGRHRSAAVPAPHGTPGSSDPLTRLVSTAVGPGVRLLGASGQSRTGQRLARSARLGRGGGTPEKPRLRSTLSTANSRLRCRRGDCIVFGRRQALRAKEHGLIPRKVKPLWSGDGSSRSRQLAWGTIGQSSAALTVMTSVRQIRTSSNRVRLSHH